MFLDGQVVYYTFKFKPRHLSKVELSSQGGTHKRQLLDNGKGPGDLETNHTGPS